MKKYIYLIFPILFLSCKSTAIFQDKTEATTAVSTFQLLGKETQHILMPDDKLSVSIWNHDDLSIGSIFSIYNTNEAFGKWVLIEADSTAAIPYIGTIALAGLKLDEAEELVALKMAEFINNPIVEIKVLNREITLLGEVNAPGNYILEKEQNTLIEYIGKAQGLNFYADTRKIQVIRNEISYPIDLTHLENFSQKNIFLQANDIVYIPSKKGKKLDLKAPVLIPFASLLTSLGVLISVVSK